jgi:hypothetical protein
MRKRSTLILLLSTAVLMLGGCTWSYGGGYSTRYIHTGHDVHLHRAYKPHRSHHRRHSYDGHRGYDGRHHGHYGYRYAPAYCD